MSNPVVSDPVVSDPASPYDAVADRYAELFQDPTLASEPGDREILDRFAARLSPSGSESTSPEHRVADLGCGPGHATAYLAAAGLAAFGIDLSVPMITIAKRSYRDLQFAVGSLAALPLPTRSLDGVLVRFSIIHTPPDEVPDQLAEVARVLRTGGSALFSFQAVADGGPEVEPFDHRVTTGYRWHPDRMAGLLGQAGLTELDRLVNPVSEGHRFPEAHLLLAKG